MFKKITATILLLALLGLAMPRPARADAWGTNLAAAIEGVTLTKMLDTIEKTMVANLKIMAIRIIQGRLQVLLTGSCGAYCIGGSSGFITDWQDYIFGSAQRTAENTVNTFFNGMRSGVGSGMERVVNNAQKRLDAEVLSTKKPNLQNYVSEGKVEYIFDPTKSVNNRWIAFRKSFEPQNDEGYIALGGYTKMMEAFRQQEELRKTKATSYQGFTGTEKKPSQAGKYGPMGYGSENEGYESVSEEGLTSLPGSVTKDFTSEISLMGVKMIEFARSIPEVVANMVAQTITSLINYGIRQVTDPIDNAVINVRNKVGTSINQTQSDIQSGMRESIYFNKKQ
ncbi:MAG: hypothetical protein A2359_02690 [Candidatus Moranbacteria bacterium RIFOXYB1_FULL_43_19]|nr:MAG: hypothetical protein A2359_02690 [Candidatus Moranbacteria bacterium RIFOXYB1_FULL_43_19]OGI28989.1 MAG: hypothetical protein A2184_03645 [Candidatus Moranbacteria bacterium RIFOXYA1_FULL_44_7]